MLFLRRWTGRVLPFGVMILVLVAAAASGSDETARLRRELPSRVGKQPIGRPYAAGTAESVRVSPARVLWKPAAAAYRPARGVSGGVFDRPPVGRLAFSGARPRETPATGHGARGPSAANAAATDLVVFQDDTFTMPAANRSSQRPEPGLSVNDPVVFATGNHYAQLSTDGGKTFTFIDPAVAFTPAKPGFCCEQTTLYVPSRDLLVWLLQYASDASGNVLRLAVSRGQSNQAIPSWAYADLTPQGLGAGFPPGSFSTSAISDTPITRCT